MTAQTTQPVDPARAEEIRKRIGRLNNLSMLLGLAGIVGQVVGKGIGGVGGVLLMTLGAASFVGGCAFYARMRGQSAWFGALGLLSCLGFIVLFFLPKKCMNCGRAPEKKVCVHCGAPAPY